MAPWLYSTSRLMPTPSRIGSALRWTRHSGSRQETGTALPMSPLSRRLLRPGIDAQRFRLSDEIRDGSGRHLSHDVRTMHLHGDLAEIHLGGDLLVHQASYDEPHNFSFARCERVVRTTERRHRLFGGETLTVARQRFGDGIQHLLVAKRLRKKIDCPRFHGLDCHRNVTMPGHEYDRHAHTSLRYLLLQGKAIFAAQPDIENQATARAVLRESEKVP